VRGLRTLLFFLCSIGFTSNLYSMTSKVILLTSLDSESNRPPLRSKNWNINDKLEKRFRRYLKRYDIDLEPQVIHYADQFSLFEALTSGEAKAVLWISHAGYKSKQGLSKAASIVDYRGRDLKGVFQALGPSIKFLGLIGCQGQSFIDDWRASGWPNGNHELTTFSRSKKTDARKGLKLAMKSLGSAFNNDRLNFLRDSHQVQENSTYVEVDITRVNRKQSQMNSIQVYQRKRLLTVLPASLSKQTATLRIKTSPNDRLSDLKIVLDTGDNSLAQNINIGRIEFNAPFQDHWKLFSTPDGVPFGVGTNIYNSKVALIE